MSGTAMALATNSATSGTELVKQQILEAAKAKGQGCSYNATKMFAIAKPWSKIKEMVDAAPFENPAKPPEIKPSKVKQSHNHSQVKGKNMNNTSTTGSAAAFDFSGMSAAQLMAEFERLKNENAALKVKKTAPITFKVSEKGAVSAYGLGRFPVTLYGQQWQRLMNPATITQLQGFLDTNKAVLTVKE